jgi:hypothetical protein
MAIEVVDQLIPSSLLLFKSTNGIVLQDAQDHPIAITTLPLLPGPAQSQMPLISPAKHVFFLQGG